ncbi:MULTISPECIES: hypothetical protein [unclassified Bradyrhizobium]|uniref:hypothetical protein n=1 Tax=unclassified Bradyrhizobium TaxID=2631580 RepID=UPI001FF9F67D|nr:MULTISPECIES: hypothetical protein [unclassified Bradyrhizobium]
MSDEINDQIHVIGCPDGFELDLIRNEKGCCATANKHQPLAQFISQRAGRPFATYEAIGL